LLTADRWRPDTTLVMACVALLLFLLAFVGAVGALRGPVGLGYRAVPINQSNLWRIVAIWPDGFAHDVGLRRGMLLYSPNPPATRGPTILTIWTAHHVGRRVAVPLKGETVAALEGLELLLAAAVEAIGVGTLLLARERGAALLLLLLCQALALGLCGAASFAHGALWGSVLLETCVFVLLTPLTPLLALALPPSGRTRHVDRRLVGAMIVLLLALDSIGFLADSLYVSTRAVAGCFFVAAQIGAVTLWVWRAGPEWHSPAGAQYRLVFVGLGGALGSFALLAVVPSILSWPPPWPREAGGVGLVLFPLCLAWALLRHHLLHLRQPLQRALITLALLSGTLMVGLMLAQRAGLGVGVGAAVLLAGLGIPLAQWTADRLLPDGRTIYAALLRESSEHLDTAVNADGLRSVLDHLCRGLGLRGLRLCHDNTVLAQAGAIDGDAPLVVTMRHEGRTLATLEVGEKIYHAVLLAADYEALEIVGQQLVAYLVRQRLVLDLRVTVDDLEDARRRLLGARRRERERLSQELHRGPLQDILLLAQTLPLGSSEADAADSAVQSLRSILTEAGSTVLPTLGLVKALQAYVTHLSPLAQSRNCTITAAVDEHVMALPPDDAFALYQLAHEALTNAVRHSGGHRVTLRLWIQAGEVLLDVRDDGCSLPQGWDHPRLDHRGLRDALDLMQSLRGAKAGATRGPDGGTVVWASMLWHPRPVCGVEQEQQVSGNEMGETIDILIAEDHALMRQGLRRLLETEPQFRVVAEAATGHEVLSLVLKHQPAILLLDIDLPGQNGLDTLAELHTHVAHLPRVIVLSAFHEEEYVRRAHELKVAGFLSKGCNAAQLHTALRRILAGERVFEAPIAATLREQSYSAAGRFRRYSDGSPSISVAELPVLQAMMGDDTYEQIGVRLGRSLSTVRSQAAKICEKLGVNSRQQAVLRAVQLGILSLGEKQIAGTADEWLER